jgi:hypothetical protein
MAVNTPTTLAGWAIWLIVLAGIVVITYVGLTALGVAIPGWVVTIFWVVLVVVVVVAAIKFLATRV